MNHVLDGGTYGRHLANIIERSVLGSDVAGPLVFVNRDVTQHIRE